MVCACICGAQDRPDWKSVSALTPGDRVRFTLRSGKSFVGSFHGWTSEDATIDTTLVNRADVKKVERIRSGGRVKHAAIGAAAGFGMGFAIGAAAGGCHPNDFICLGRGKAGAAVGGAGLVVGAIAGALLPAHRRDVIYEIP